MGGRATGPKRWGGERRFTLAKGALMEGVTVDTCSITRKQSFRLARGVWAMCGLMGGCAREG